jgi:membrane protein
MRNTLGRIWAITLEVVDAFIAFYVTTALVPILYIVLAIVGGFFGQDAARSALLSDVERFIGPQVASLLQSALKNAAYASQGFIASAISVGMLIVVASGVFGETRSALNAVWRVEPKPDTWGHFFRVRAESLALVAFLALLLLGSLLLTAFLSGLGRSGNVPAPATPLVLQCLNFFVMWLLTGILFTAIYRILPDKDLGWRDVAMGGAVTALLFQLGQIAIGFYIASTRTVSVFGAAGSLMALLLWVYYSAEIFLFGAELTRVYSAYRDGEAEKPG